MMSSKGLHGKLCLLRNYLTAGKLKIVFPTRVIFHLKHAFSYCVQLASPVFDNAIPTSKFPHPSSRVRLSDVSLCIMPSPLLWMDKDILHTLSLHLIKVGVIVSAPLRETLAESIDLLQKSRCPQRRSTWRWSFCTLRPAKAEHHHGKKE